MMKQDEDSQKYKSYISYCAARLAQELHKGQKDKAGKDYFTGHLAIVGGSGENWKEKTVGFLHDAAEDTGHSVDDVMALLKRDCHKYPLISSADRVKLIEKYKAYVSSRPNDKIMEIGDDEFAEIAEALNLMNAHTAKSRETYIARFAGHELAIRVKLHDLESNSNLSRIPSPTETDYARTERYRKEHDQLVKMLDMITAPKK